MSTKNTIQALSDANLASASNITAAEHRAVNDSFIDEFYGVAPIQETQASNVITDVSGDGNFYSVYFSKQGNRVKITGVLINKQTVITSTTSFFEIIDAEYLPNTSSLINSRIYGNNSINHTPIKLSIGVDNVLRISGSSLGVGQNINIDFEYLTQD